MLPCKFPFDFQRFVIFNIKKWLSGCYYMFFFFYFAVRKICVVHRMKEDIVSAVPCVESGRSRLGRLILSDFSYGTVFIE